jgi:hypothetical protein
MTDHDHPLLIAAQQSRRDAEDALSPCRECDGFPLLAYEPGSTYSTCLHNRRDCPCLERAPDEDYPELVRRINAKNRPE